MMTKNRLKKIDDLFETEGQILHAASLRKAHFCSKDITYLVQQGYLAKVKRGYYTTPAIASSMTDQELITSILPDGVISLFSAATYHNMTTVNPKSVEITLPSNKRTPALPSTVPVRVYKSIDPIYSLGIETVTHEGFIMKVYDRERTVCDFIRLRSQIGKDAAFEVLKNYMSGKKNLQKLYNYADRLQIKNVIHPYLEVLA